MMELEKIKWKQQKEIEMTLKYQMSQEADRERNNEKALLEQQREEERKYELLAKRKVQEEKQN